MALRELNPKRNYGIDALRVLSMLMIVMYHLIYYSGLLGSRDRFSLSYDAVLFLQLALMCAVNCYVLISGYVGVTATHRYSRLVELWLRVLIYSAGITLFYYLFRPGTVSFTALWKSFIPGLSREYWFFSSYFVLFLVMPLLNAAVNTLSRRRMKILLFTLLLFVGVIGSIYYAYTTTDSYGVNRGYSAWWMMILYLVGAYIRKYDVLAGTKHRKFLLTFVLTVAASTALKLLIQSYAIGKYHSIRRFGTAFTNYNSVNLVICAIALLLFFRNLQIKPILSRIITVLSPLTFSVYLIHDHPLIRARIMKSAFLFLQKMSLPLMLLCAVGIAVGIYLVCSAVDLIRHWLFRLLKIRKRLDSLETGIRAKLNKEQ